jgi:hypothetical protein
MPVETDSGKALGFVVDVLPGQAGTEESGFVVIAGSGSGTTPVPYGAARGMIHDGKLVIEDSRFERAPRVPQSQLEDPAASAWQDKARQYWTGRARKQAPAHDEEKESPEEQPRS